MRFTKGARIGAWVSVAALALTTGCATPDKLTRGHFERVRVHAATQADVRELIGEPDNRLGDLWMYHRPDAHLEVMIDFDEQGRVARKQWIDAAGEQWDDSSDKPRRGGGD